MSWRPTADIDTLRSRSQFLKSIREFFYARDVYEVETPLMAATTSLDPNIESFSLEKNGETHYLQTSPEFYMKRLLAAGSGSIFQICKAFRREEEGRLHNSEFTMLEWYRIGFTHHQLMDEIDELLKVLGFSEKSTRISYAEVFKQYCDIDPHIASIEDLQRRAEQLKINIVGELNKNAWLQLLLNHCVEPNLGINTPCFLYDFPTGQAALAKIRQDNPSVAERFELYINGIEIANGFHELTDAKEQLQRFENENKIRTEKLLVDGKLIAALHSGLPACSGVALGMDRLIKVVLRKNSLQETTSFME